MKHFALILFFVTSLQAQLFSTKASRLASGSGAPASGDCAGDSDVDRVYIQKGSTTSDFRCRKTGASTYAWVDVTSGGGGGGSGTVTSVALTLPAIFGVTGSPVTTSGTLAATLANQTANLIFAGPSSGGAAAPTFRALVGADLPNPGASSKGGVQSITCSGTDKISEIGTNGVPVCTADQNSGGGATSASALTDLAGTKTSSTVLTIGAACSTSAPCRVWFGTSAKTFTAASTLTISGTSAGGTAHCWVDDNGIQCGHNSATTITGSGISVQTGITTMGYGWPIGSFTWTANVWDTVTAAMDKRMFAGFPAARPGADGSLVVTRTPGGWDEWSLANPKYIVIAAPLASANTNAGSAGGGWTHGVANTWYGGTQPFVHYAKSSPVASVYIFRMPEIWNGGQIKANLTAITSNNVNGGPRTWAFGIRVACLDDDAVVETATYNTQGVQTVSMPNTTAVIHQRKFSILSGGSAGQFPLSGCAPNSYVKLELNRDVGNAAESPQNEAAGIQDMQLLIPVL